VEIASERIGEWVMEALSPRSSLSLCHTESWSAPGHLKAEFIHGIFESDSIFTPLDGIHLNTDHLNAVFFKHTCPCQF